MEIDKLKYSIGIVEKYISKRSILGINTESFGIVNEISSKFYGEISLIGLDSSLEHYTVPDFVDSIGIRDEIEYKYYGIRHTGNIVIQIGSSKLKELTIGKNVEYIQKDAFYGSNIEKIDIKGNIKEIGKDAFRYRIFLNEIDFTKCKDVIIGFGSFCGAKN